MAAQERSDPISDFGRQVEARVLHAQRPEQALLQEHIERHARDHRDEIAQHIETLAVGELLSRMMVQRQLGEAQDAPAEGHGLGGEEVHHAGLGVELLEAGVAVDDAIPETRGVREQIAEGDLALGRFAGPGAVGLVVGLEHLRLLELRDPVRHRIIEAEPALLPQHHHRGRGDGLGLRGDAEDVVALERPPGLVVGHAEGLVVHHLAIAGHQSHRPRDAPLANGLFAQGIDPRQPLGRHARLLRRRLPQGR